ncbi:ABC transporter permease [Pseudoflavonifractor gallinarum]|uniref:ABC transporter permease n=1 Tax=Pseudoflavonifractor hominis TaxID=2763059 RepID=A0ABR7HR16_9FIRM|nr:MULTISPECIES: ABC transporter permease [Eubacteriales]MBC5729872.1 ABC transporter permease [Pseudoflavonifractor hominis]MBS5134390.1 ABC transporter permease [Oscillospiraceae bacterium]
MAKKNPAQPVTLQPDLRKKNRSQMSLAMRRLMKNKTAILGLIIIISLILLALFADVLFDYDEVVIKQNIAEMRQPPSLAHPFGTDELGRDILARVVHGTRVSLSIGFTSTLLASLIGGTIGAVSGYFGKRVDMIISRIMDMLLAIPGTLLAIAIVAVLGTSVTNLIMAMVISSIPKFARITRGAVLTVKDVEYIEAARAIGATDRTIILSHVIPNCMAPILVEMTLNISFAILTISGLSFLGLGVEQPRPEWGAMLSSSRTYIRDYSYMALFPGLAIMVTILAFNLLGDGLRDALDPRLK